MKDELRINGKDAYTTWGISMDNNACLLYTSDAADEL